MKGGLESFAQRILDVYSLCRLKSRVNLLVLGSGHSSSTILEIEGYEKPKDYFHVEDLTQGDLTVVVTWAMLERKTRLHLERIFRGVNLNMPLPGLRMGLVNSYNSEDP